MYRFNDDIDNSEEEDLTDDEMRERIKARKNKERDRRDDLTMVKMAALAAAKNVEETRKRIGVGSVVTQGINLDALKLRHAKLRDNMEMDKAPLHTDKKSKRKLNERSGELRISDTDSFDKLSDGYEPC